MHPGIKGRIGRLRLRQWLGLACLVLLVVVMGVGFYHQYKPLPEGLDVATPMRPARDVRFLSDETWQVEGGERRMEQAIFDEVLRLIGQAERLVVLDMFLFNDFAGATDAEHRPLSDQLTEALIQRRQTVPGLRAVVITDPFNTVYGSLMPDHLRALEAAGVRVILTDLARLRDPNPAWSSIWRVCCQWLGNDQGGGWLPNPFGETPITLRSYLDLLNFKANHRKTLVVDEGESWTGLVTSANPHDASSAHSNVALRFSGRAALDLLKTEQAVAEFSGDGFPLPDTRMPAAPNTGARIQILTESAIRDAAMTLIDQSSPGERLDMAMFYFSHRGLLEAMLAAHERGVNVRVLLDPNRDAFGRTKQGIPNRQVAWELHRAGIPVRWCNTSGEQCHGKLLMRRSEVKGVELLLGSANFTRRNLDNYNLETNVRLVTGHDHRAASQASEFFHRIWNNQPANRRYSLPYAAFSDHSWFRYWRYRLMEATGLSTF
jgi:phosphatidylserine/phosphatidylglycerophosphate/cardiolipin synthase-like enzyme